MYKCEECDYTSKSYFGICPRCKNGVGVEIEEKISIKNGNKSSYVIRQVSKKDVQDKVILKTKYESLNKVISSQSGFIEHQVIAFGAEPGTGKSTLCTEIANEDSLYISTEESYNQVNSRFLRVNPNSKSSIVAITDIKSIIEIIETCKEHFIIIDSLNSINNGMDGYAKQAQNMSLIVQSMKKNNKFGIIICQVTRKGEITGFNTILHVVDTVMHLERSSISSDLILSCDKNRFGEIGSIAIFKHTNNGLIESAIKREDDDCKIGTTYTKAKFGYKSMDINVQALVAPSSLNVGLKKVNGVPLSRVQQILGILAYNSPSINFVNKDVYVSIGNGLTVNDTKIDLAIANSILSSYFNVPSKFNDIEGEINLNGSIIGSDKFKNITDLIKIYK